MAKLLRPMKGPQILDPETNKILAKIPFPVFGTPKFDGIRGTMFGTKVYTDKLKPIPNDHIRRILADHAHDGDDGEIVTYTAGKRDSFNTIQSKVMKKTGKPEFTFHVFDKAIDGLIHADRLKQIIPSKLVSPVVHVILYNLADVWRYFEDCLKAGYEGIMLRDPTSTYKHGRSTFKEFALVKMKRFLDSEAELLDVKERMKNTGKSFKGETGLLKKRKLKKNLVPTGLAGSIIGRDINPDSPHYGKIIKVGLRMKEADKAKLLKFKARYVGRIFTYKYQGSGQKELPRFAQFYRWRVE